MHEPRPAAVAALAWLTHPVTCVALVLLLVNDHVLKAMWGSWWTGKLSDVAWLVVGPPLLATLAVGAAGLVCERRPSARGWTRVSVAVVGVAFVVVKSTAAGAAVASALLTALAGPSLVLADPTDLLALPALALARATSTSGPPERGPGACPMTRWLVVLPVAVLATTATSQVPANGTMEVAVVDGTLMVGDSSGSGPDGANWYLSDDGASWDAVYSFSGEADEVVTRFVSAGGTFQSLCVPDSATHCFRVAERGLGVDRSDDAGHTWRADWSIPANVQAGLADRYEREGAPLRTVGVAIWPTPDGFRVYAANAGDGLAVRDERGTWQRLGFAHQPNGPPVVPLPGEPTPMDHPLPWGVVLGVAVAMLALALSGRRRAGSPPRSDRVLGGRSAALGAAVVAGVAALANNAWGVVDGQELGSDTIFGPVLPVAVVAVATILAIVLAVVGGVLLRGGRATGLIAVTGAAVALVVELVSPRVLAAVVAVVILGAGVAATRATTDPPHRGGGQPVAGVPRSSSEGRKTA